MYKLPNNLADKIYLDSLILTKREEWKHVHKELQSVKKVPIRSVININGTLYKYILNNYLIIDYQYILPKLRTGERFYSAGYVQRIANIDWESLPTGNINEEDIVIDYLE